MGKLWEIDGQTVVMVMMMMMMMMEDGEFAMEVP